MKIIINTLILMMLTVQVSATEVMLVGTDPGTRGYRIILAVLEAISEEIGVEFTTQSLPLKRVFSELRANSGGYTGALAHVDGLEKKIVGLIKIPEPYGTVSSVAVARENFNLDGWKSLGELRLCHRAGMKVIESKIVAHKYKSYGLTDLEQGLRFVARNRADVFLTPALLIDKVLQKPEFKDAGLRILEPVLSTHSFYTYMVKGNEELAEKYNNGLKALKANGTYKRILANTK